MTTTPCVTTPAAFQHALLEDDVPLRTAAERRTAGMLTERAATLCSACPLFTECLYRAVADHDVAGVVAGTTAVQRREMRRRLQVQLKPENLDSLAGVTRRGRFVTSEEVVRLRRLNPDASLELIAEWLGCSLTTVKRHLRKSRQAATTPEVEVSTGRPGRTALMSVFAEVTGRYSGTDRAA